VCAATTIASEPLMTGRDNFTCCQNQPNPLGWDKFGGSPADCPNGNRPEGGVSAALALFRNLGTCRADAKGKHQVEETHKMQSTDAAHRGGSARSRDEGAVIARDRRGTVVEPCHAGNSQEEDPRG
jgi:hypothetical protein